MATSIPPLTPPPPPSSSSNKEKANHTRLCRLLVDIGRQVLHDVFDKIHPPSKLNAVLWSPYIQNILKTLKTKKILYGKQWDTLFPKSGTVTSADLDITLLFLLLRNISSLKTPGTGWDKPPLVIDDSKEADIVRIKRCRNELYAHIVNAAIPDNEFQTLWGDIETVLVRLGGSKYQVQIRRYKHETIDPESDHSFNILLQSWEEDEHNTILAVREGSAETLVAIRELHEKIDKVMMGIKCTVRIVTATELVSKFIGGATYILDRYREAPDGVIKLVSGAIIIPLGIATAVIVHKLLPGCFKILVEIRSLDALDAFWKSYKEGDMKENLEKVIVTDELRSLAKDELKRIAKEEGKAPDDVKNVYITLEISEHDYGTTRDYLSLRNYVEDPVPQAETIYQAFDKKKHVPEVTPFNPYENNSDDSHDLEESKKPVAKKRVQSKPPKSDREVLEEGLKQVDLRLLKDTLAKDEVAYPSNPLLWLKDLASYLHLKLQNLREKDPVFDDQDEDYPCCLLKDDVRSFLTEVLKNSSSGTLGLFYEYLMNEMAQELSRGHSVYGMQIMIQLTVKVCPTITVNNLDEFEKMLDGRKSRPREALSIMWALGQLPNNDIAQGMQVWTKIMMPMLQYKQLAKFSMDYLENLLKKCSKSTKNIIGSDDFLNILQLTLSSKSPLASNHSLKRKMVSLYPKLKALSFGSNPSSTGRVYFPSLLGYLKADEVPQEYRTEVLDCLRFCLQNDPECFSIWMDLYPTSLVESSVLIYYIVDTWSTRSAKVPKDQFQKLVSTFQVFNSQQADQGQNPAGFEDCVKACHVAEEKTKCRSSCLSFRCLLKLVVVILIGVITFDIYKHKGYQGSKTSRYAKEYGIEQGTIRFYGHVKHGFNKGNNWIQENYPAYYSQFREYADPAAQYTKDKFFIAYNYIAEQTEPARKYLSKKIPEILEKIETEVPKYWAVVCKHTKYYWDNYWPVVHHYLVVIQELFLKYVPPLIQRLHEMLMTLATSIYELAPEFFDSIMAWFDKVGQSITEKIPDVIAVVQEYAIIASNLIVNLVNNAITWVQSLANSGETADDIVSKQTTSTKSFPK